MPESSTLAFELTRLWFGVRDLFTSPATVVGEAGIVPGACVLDYGCGPGSHALAALQLVGASGRVYAADINPLAVARLQAIAARRGLGNLHGILTDCATGLEGASVDVALLYDTYHDLAQPQAVLAELHRVLKPGGVLSFSDHHLQEQEILAQVTAAGLFAFEARGRKTYTFRALGPDVAA